MPDDQKDNQEEKKPRLFINGAAFLFNALDVEEVTDIQGVEYVGRQEAKPGRVEGSYSPWEPPGTRPAGSAAQGYQQR
jgi:hypothetical protein